MPVKHNMEKWSGLFAVTGNPIFHSKSPFMFNRFFQLQHINDRYRYIKIAAATAGEAIFLFKELKLKGMNVTAPFKRDIMDYLDVIDPEAEKIGAVNTVTWEKNRLKGYNTDYLGVTEALKQIGNGMELAGKRCVVLGAGGAGRAAVYGLVKEKALVTLVNRTLAKATQVAEEFGCEAQDISLLPDILSKADILVSTLPYGVDIIPVNWLPEKLVVLDANYKQTSLSKKAKEKGCRVVRGEEWLLHQAIPAYQYFLGTLPQAPAVFATTQKDLLSLSPRPLPKNIALVGFMGSGKSLTGAMLAQKRGMEFLDLDELVETEAGCSIPDIFRLHGEETFRSLERRLLKRELMNRQGVVYACGGGAVLSGENRRVLEEYSVVVWLYASIASTLKRIPPGTRPLLDCPNPGQTAQQLLGDRLFLYALASDLVVCSEGDVPGIVEKIDNEIGKTINH